MSVCSAATYLRKSLMVVVHLMDIEAVGEAAEGRPRRIGIQCRQRRVRNHCRIRRRTSSSSSRPWWNHRGSTTTTTTTGSRTTNTTPGHHPRTVGGRTGSHYDAVEARRRTTDVAAGRTARAELGTLIRGR